jgi:erythromycin esterase-like protein
MARDDADSWNVRDRHMAETLDRLMRLHGPNAKAIVWAHNTHVGDARYTDMAQEGMVNLGQLVRESHADAGTYIVGFGTYQGEVIAGKRWDAPYERMPVPQAPKNSWDELLHAVSPENKIVLLNQLRSAPELASARGQRAIGVVYNPARESGNYVPTVLAERYDGFIFIDKTRALHPLDVTVGGRKAHDEAPVGAYALIND